MRVLLTRRRAVAAIVTGLLVATTAVANDSLATTASTGAGTAEAGTGRLPTLHAVNRITAAHPTRAYIAVPRPVALHKYGIGLIEGLTVHGAGRMYGIALTDPRGRRGFVDMHFNPCFARGCHRSSTEDPTEMAISWDATAPVSRPFDAPLRLPAGRYVLSVYSDGTPVHVTWQVPELSGRQRLLLHTSQYMKVTSPEDTVPATGPVRTEAQFYGTASLRSDVLVMAETDKVTKGAHVTNETSWCIYSGARPGDRPTPQCAGGSGMSMGWTSLSLKSEDMGYGLAVLAGHDAAGRYLQSVDDNGVQAISDAHANLLWADAGWQSQ